MINPAEIADNLVALLRKIPALVAEMGGDETRISAYHDAYPERASLELAIYEMPAPSLLVAWQGTGPGIFGGMEAWKHQFSIFLRSRKELPGEAPAGYYRLFRLITRGVPSDGTLPLISRIIHTDCHPMDTPTIMRQTPQNLPDYMEVSVSFTEIGDS